MNFPRDRNDEKYALCIVNTYQLQNALNDTLAQIIMLLNWGYVLDNIYILCDRDSDARIRFLKDFVHNNKKINIKYNNGTNFLSNYQDILRIIAIRAKGNASLYISITGHGGRIKDRNGDEKDGLDEFIYPNGKVVIDDDLYKGLKILGSNFYVMGAVDTCHSGTMFDLDSTKHGPLKCQAFSVSACADSEVDWEIGCKTDRIKDFIRKNFSPSNAAKYQTYIPRFFITGSLTANIIDKCFDEFSMKIFDWWEMN